MACCEDPKPRILERNGRPFCANCRQWLDVPADVPKTEIVSVVKPKKEPK